MGKCAPGGKQSTLEMKYMYFSFYLGMKTAWIFLKSLNHGHTP